MGSAELYGGILAGAGQPGLMQSIMEKRRQQADAKRQLAEDELKFGKTPEEQAAYRAAILQKIQAETARAQAEADFYTGGGSAGAKSRADADTLERFRKGAGKKPGGGGTEGEEEGFWSRWGGRAKKVGKSWHEDFSKPVGSALGGLFMAPDTFTGHPLELLVRYLMQNRVGGRQQDQGGADRPFPGAPKLPSVRRRSDLDEIVSDEEVRERMEGRRKLPPIQLR